jgi:hypothetical protein
MGLCEQTLFFPGHRSFRLLDATAKRPEAQVPLLASPLCLSKSGNGGS